MVLAFVLSVVTAGSTAAAPAAAALLADSDRARGGLATGVTWNVQLDSVEDGASSSRTFLVKAKGNDSLVTSLAPPRNKGEVMLFNDRTLWFIKPGLRKPVSISARQKLTGLAANGDLASTNYARDYTGTVGAEETVNGEPALKLDLKAKSKDVTYDQIHYWISKKSHLGLKAEFLTVSGQVFKTATFEYSNTVTVDGKPMAFVSVMNIKDAMGSSNSSVIKFSQPRVEAHPDSTFNINNVVH